MPRLSILLLVVLLSCQDSLRHEGIEIREMTIPLPDGVKLAADLYVPEGSSEKLPVLLEYLPYRKDEGRRNRFGLYAYFVKRGYIVARVDIRGTGNSEGMLIPYEYSEQEQKDGEVVIDWLSRQSFSNGNVGMFGISWGGFNALHMAMRRPPALKTIITVMSTDDIYQDDVHFMDGMMHIDAYEIGQDLSNILPGAPGFKIDEDYFKNRFETTPWLLQYKKQQRDGPFWDRASLNADYEKINIPVFAIGGWYDGYRDAVFRMLENVKSPVKAMVGPWNHTFPNWADPPPAIEWREDAVRWFDHWLKGKETGIMDEPPLQVFVRDWHPPGTDLKKIEGEWHSLRPGKGTRSELSLHFSSERNLTTQVPRSGKEYLHQYQPSAGPEAGGSVMWWGDWSPDQRAGDSSSLVFETEPLDSDLVILGFPQAELTVRADAPRANWFVRLNDVAPEGSVTLVTGAGANGTHRSSAEQPSDIVKAEWFSLPVELHATSWTFRKGHRIRVTVSNALWPMIWPTPYPFTSSLKTGPVKGSQIRLPLLHDSEPMKLKFPPSEEDLRLPGYASIAAGTNSGYAEVSAVNRDPQTGLATVKLMNNDGYQYPWGKVFSDEEIVHEVNDRDPSKARTTSIYAIRVEVAGRSLRFEGQLKFESDLIDFHYTYTRKVFENGTLLREHTWQEKIPRDYQ
ncbi:MAG: CocE/NonD family hydrolase [Cyclobacteriaceae bacterium]|nr:CocE/NonD family hydrolase [Cyclobacteriaceae bacterium]